MKRLQYILNLLLAGLLMTACTKELVNTTFEKEVTLKLRFASDNLQSRAEGDVTDPEYAFYTIDLFLYQNNTNQETVSPIVTVPRVDYETINGDTDNNHEVEVSVPLSDAEMKSLFGNDYSTATNNLTCYAYAIVNGPDIPSNNDKKIANLKQIAIEATFTDPQTQFVMDGGNTITYSPTNKVVTGNIPVIRAASKISLFVTGIDKTVKDDAGNIWIPYQETKVETGVPYFPIEVALNKGVKKANVNVGEGRPNNPHTYANDKIVDVVFFNTENRDMDNTFVEGEDKYTLTTTHDPFYTYSSDWGRDTNPDYEPSITLMVPWVKKFNNEGKEIENASYQMCYYQVPINAIKAEGKEADCFERNTYYRIDLHVGILGDFDPNNPVKLTASYYAVEWEPQPVDVNIKNYKYLVVDKNDVTVYNENEVRIGYASSDAINAEITYIRRPDYSDEKVDTTRFHGTLASTSGLSTVPQGTNSLLRQCAVTIENNEIVLKHDIVNQSTISGTNYDYVPYYIWIKVTMTVTVNGENKTFTEWIRYEQYPAMYIKANLNSDYDNDKSINGNKGFVWVNGVRDAYGTVGGMSGLARNANPNMYIITTTSLDKSSEYILGDPRTTQIDNLNNNKWATAPAIYNGTSNRKLLYYYPTRSTADAKNMISPKFRIASSYGVTNGISSTNAKYRCASYQEDGYPAGRWRVPTRSEIEYVVRLSAEQKIPTLFNNGGNYWAADNTICVPNSANGGSVDTGSSNSAFVRCVYDEWYWTDTCNKTTFTWGDAPKN